MPPRSPLVSLLLCAACATAPPIDGKSAYAVDTEPVTMRWLRLANEVPLRRYALLENIGKISASVRGDSAYWAERFFEPIARPLDQKALSRLAAHASDGNSPDLLRFQYPVDDLELTVVESNAFVAVWVRGSPIGHAPQLDNASIMNHLAAHLFAVKGPTHDWQLVSLTDTGAEATYSSNAGVDPFAMHSWEDRIDAGIEKGVPYFLFFKKNPAKVGYALIEHWFDDSFRKDLRSW